MKKILTVVGARPQFIKAAPLSLEIRKVYREIIIHTGQHYDESMSDLFFDELGIPSPDYNLNVGSGSHGEQTGKMLVEIEKILLFEKPDMVLVFGDTNSTLAGALAAVKLHIPIIHVEAGLRSFNKDMPEEHNRVLTDHMSTLLFCPTGTAVLNLKNEGIVRGVHQVGDVMADSVRLFSQLAKEIKANDYMFENKGWNESNQSTGYYLATIHRAENTDRLEALVRIFEYFGTIDQIVVLPVHPRLKGKLTSLCIPQNVILIPPQGYLEMLGLIKGSLGVLTDSGGLQKEAYILKRKCTTLRSETEWVETLTQGWNTLCNPMVDSTSFFSELLLRPTGLHLPLYGDGETSQRIVEIIQDYFMN